LVSKTAKAILFFFGDMVQLIHTEDPYTQLQSGDTGRFIELWSDDLPNVKRLKIAWDNGSNLSLIVGVDKFEKIK